MPRIKEILLASLVLATPALFSQNVQALEYKNSFGSINAGYADWNSGFVNVHRGEVWKATADFGVNFREAEFYSFIESNVLNHAVAGRNHTVSAMTHVRLFDSDYTFFGKIYGQWDNSWGDDLDMFYGLGYLEWSGVEIGVSLNLISACITNQVTMYHRNMDRPVDGMDMLLVGLLFITSLYLVKALFYLTGMKSRLIEMMLTRSSNSVEMV